MLDSKHYSMGSQLQFTQNQVFLDSMCPLMNFEEKERVLDVGCGTGNVTVNLLLPRLPKDSSMVAVDFPNMISYANNHHSDPRVKYESVNIEDSDLKNKLPSCSFNKVFSLFCEQWIKDHRLSFSNFYHLLKTGGYLCMIIPDNLTYAKTEGYLLSLPKWKKYTQFMDKYAYLRNEVDNFPEVYFHALNDNNFAPIYTELKYSRPIFENKQSYLDFSKGISLLIKHVPEDDVDNLMKDYWDSAIKHELISVGQHTGRVELVLDLLYVLVVKQ